jgi:PAS domain-containing protein
MIQRLGLTPANDLFDKLEDGDVVEIYDRDENQIYRNLQFFRVSSYTFEDLMHYRLHELFGRPLWDMLKLLRELRSARSPKFRGTMTSCLAEYEVREKLSQRRYRARIKHKYFSPLLDQNGDSVALVCTHTVKVIGEDGPA